MIWESRYFLWLLLLVPIFWILVSFYQRRLKEQTAAYFNTELLEQMYVGQRSWVKKLQNAFLSISLILMIIALAGPKIGTEVREIKRRGVDVMIALDLSLSMNAEDVSPSRLEKAKYEISRLLERLKGDRVGLIVFTGEAWLQSPMTMDYSALRLFLNIANSDQMPSSTTDFASAMGLANRAFEAIKEESKAAKVLLIVSDGEDQGDPYEDALSDLISSNIAVYTLGVGTTQGGTIPIYDKSNRLVGYKRDRNSGTVVVSKLQSKTLSEIAAKGNGNYYQIQRGSDGLDAFIQKIDQLEKGEFAQQEYADFKNQYQFLLAGSLLFFLMSLLLPKVGKSKQTLFTTDV